MQPSAPPPDNPSPKIRPHVFDGIQEYDHRLPNWWLNTLYGTIAFSIVYWWVYVTVNRTPTDGTTTDEAMTRIAAVKMASSIDVSSDEKLRAIGGNAVFVDAGRQTFSSLCVACHLPSMRGKSEIPSAVGPDLTDTAWLHGGTPKEIYHTVSTGVVAKGMPAWEPVLGQKKTAEVVAYILSKHHAGETITIQPSN